MKSFLQLNRTQKRCSSLNVHVSINELEALGECRHPWPRQIITTIFLNVIMLSLGGQRLNPNVLEYYLHHDQGMLPLLWCFFCSLTHLRIPWAPSKFNQFFIALSRTSRKMSSQPVHNFLSNVVHRQTDKQTNQRYQKYNLLCQGANYHFPQSLIWLLCKYHTTDSSDKYTLIINHPTWPALHCNSLR